MSTASVRCPRRHLQHGARPRTVSTRLMKMFRNVPDPKIGKAKRLADNLIEICQETDRGLTTSDEQRARILSLADQLAEIGQGAVTTDSKLSATWKLLWTTEKETLFIVKNAGLFGTKAGDVYQVIDVEDNTLENVITFPPDGAFVVLSDIAVEDDRRVNFKFRAAKLKLVGGNIPVPPFGSGWFDSVYCDDRIRVAKDIRGDTLVVCRDGPPRSFQ